MILVDLTSLYDQADYPTRNESIITDFIVHHSDGTTPIDLENAKQIIRAIDDYHRTKWPGIAYHRAAWEEFYFLLRRRSKNGWHTGGMDIEPRNGIGDANDHGLACVLLGTYTHVAPSERTLQTVAEGKAWDEAQIGRTLVLSGHQDHVSTACPGEGWRFWKYAIVLPNQPPPPIAQTPDEVINGLRIAIAHTADIVIADALGQMLAQGVCEPAVVQAAIDTTQAIREQFVGPRP